MARKFNISEIHQGIQLKLIFYKSIVEKYNLSQEEYLYLGDDVNDLDYLKFCKI